MVRRVVAGLALAAWSSVLGPGVAAASTGDPYASRQWGMALIGAPAAWTRSVGRGVVVAIVDTGIDLHHEDLPASRLVVLPGANFITPAQLPQDDQGHGTHVAGIVGAETGNGVGVESVAPGARLMPVKVLDSGGSSQGNSVEDGIRFAADHGAQVINVSIGVELVQPVTGPGFESAIEYAWSKGAVPVVAAGNNYNGSVLGSGYSPDTHAIVVAATDRNDAPATYSSGSNGARWGMAAPGGADPNFNPQEDTIFSTYWRAGQSNQYEYDAGTSMAAPHVAGAVADLLALGLTPQQAVDRLLATAKKGLDPSLGAGRLDVAAAVGVAGTGGGPSTGTTPMQRPPATRAPLGPAATASKGGSATATTSAPGGGPDTPAAAAVGGPAPVAGATTLPGSPQALTPASPGPASTGPASTTATSLGAAASPLRTGGSGLPWPTVGLAIVLLVGAGGAVAARLRHRAPG